MDPYNVVPRVRIRQLRTDGFYISAIMAYKKLQLSTKITNTI